VQMAQMACSEPRRQTLLEMEYPIVVKALWWSWPQLETSRRSWLEVVVALAPVLGAAEDMVSGRPARGKEVPVATMAKVVALEVVAVALAVVAEEEERQEVQGVLLVKVVAF